MMRSILLSLSFLCLAAPVAAADPIEPIIGTKGYANINTDSLVSLDLHFPVGELSGVIPELVGQFGFGPAAIGTHLGLSHSAEGDDGIWLGTIGLFAKGRHCFQRGGTKFCFGGQLEVGIAPMGFGDGEDLALALGVFNDLRYSRFGAEVLAFTPSLGFQLLTGSMFIQLHLGSETLVKYKDDGHDDSLTTLIAGLAAGANILDLISAGVGFRSLSQLTGGNTDHRFTLDLLAQLHLPVVKPYVMISIPLDEHGRQVMDLSLTVGAAAVF